MPSEYAVICGVDQEEPVRFFSTYSEAIAFVNARADSGQSYGSLHAISGKLGEAIARSLENETKKVADLTRRLKEEREQYRRYRDQTENDLGAYADLKLQYEQAMVEIRSLRSSKCTSATKRKIEAELATMADREHYISAALGRLKADQGKKDDEIKQLKAELAAVRSSHDSTASAFKERQARVVVLIQERDAANAEVHRLRGDLERTQARIAAIAGALKEPIAPCTPSPCTTYRPFFYCS